MLWQEKKNDESQGCLWWTWDFHVCVRWEPHFGDLWEDLPKNKKRGLWPQLWSVSGWGAMMKDGPLRHKQEDDENWSNFCAMPLKGDHIRSRSYFLQTCSKRFWISPTLVADNDNKSGLQVWRVCVCNLNCESLCACVCDVKQDLLSLLSEVTEHKVIVEAPIWAWSFTSRRAAPPSPLNLKSPKPPHVFPHQWAFPAWW